jgi:RHS repeat-associated protein
VGGWTALDYFGARYLQTATGRFVTPDPVVDQLIGIAVPQRWNRYSYVLNNPVRYTDPDGRCVFVGIDTAACIEAAGLAVVLSAAVLSSPPAQALIDSLADGLTALIFRGLTILRASGGYR